MSAAEIRFGSLKGEVGVLARQELLAALCICEGRTNKEIAQVAGVSPSTIKKTVERVFFKLQVSRRSAIVAEVMRRGIIAPACVAFLAILLVGQHQQSTTLTRRPEGPRRIELRVTARRDACAWVA